jgi:hypothetical protein
MIEAPFPQNETDRLQSLYSLALLDTPADDRFDCITRLAQKLFHVPIALVSLVDSERQWFTSYQASRRDRPRARSRSAGMPSSTRLPSLFPTP